MTVGLSVSPGAPGQGSDGLAKGEVETLDEGGLDEWPEADLAQAGEELPPQSPPHPGVSESEVPFVFTLDQLTVEQVVTGLPVIRSGAGGTKPVTEMGGEGVEVAAQTVWFF